MYDASREIVANLLFVAVMLVASHPVAAQVAPSPRVISNRPCDACTVAARRLFTMGGDDSPLDGLPSAVARDRLGRLLLLPQGGSVADSVIPIFDSTGKFLRHLARRGDGPGELRPDSPLSPVAWIDAGYDDSIRVYAARRMTVYAGAALAMARTHTLDPRFPFGPQPVRLSGGNIATGDRDLAVTIRTPLGKVIRENRVPPFGSADTLIPSRLSATRSLPGGVWIGSAHWTGYRLLKLDSLGIPREALARTPEYWPKGLRTEPWTTAEIRSLMAGDTVPRPSPKLDAVRETSRGLLIAVVALPDSQWRAVREFTQYGDHYSAAIDVFDPEALRFIGSAHVRGYPVDIVADDMLVTYREDASGAPFLDVWRLVVSVPR